MFAYWLYHAPGNFVVWLHQKKEGCQLGGVGQPDFTVGGQLLSQQQRNSNDNKMFALLQ